MTKQEIKRFQEFADQHSSAFVCGQRCSFLLHPDKRWTLVNDTSHWDLMKMYPARPRLTHKVIRGEHLFSIVNTIEETYGDLEAFLRNYVQRIELTVFYKEKYLGRFDLFLPRLPF